MHIFVSTLMVLMVQCYEAKKNLRIYLGRDANPGEFPYVVRIELKKLTPDYTLQHKCTGSAITSTWTITSGGCVMRYDLKDSKPVIVYGAVSRAPQKNDTQVDVIAWYMHPSYKFENLGIALRVQNDIGLIKSHEMNLLQYGKIGAVHYKTLFGVEVKTAGYGVMWDGKWGDTRELNTPLQVMSAVLKKCDETLIKHTMWNPAMCLGRSCSLESQACMGDGGAPIIHKSRIIGVISGRQGSCESLHSKLIGVEGVITPISPYLEWIATTIRGNP